MDGYTTRGGVNVTSTTHIEVINSSSLKLTWLGIGLNPKHRGWITSLLWIQDPHCPIWAACFPFRLGPQGPRLDIKGSQRKNNLPWEAQVSQSSEWCSSLGPRFHVFPASWQWPPTKCLRMSFCSLPRLSPQSQVFTLLAKHFPELSALEMKLFNSFSVSTNLWTAQGTFLIILNIILNIKGLALPVPQHLPLQMI